MVIFFPLFLPSSHVSFYSFSQVFRRKKWKYLVLDEAQNIKNFKSQRWQCLLNFNSQRRLLLTGTPLQNRLRLLPEPRYIPLLTLLVAKLVVVDVVSCRIGGCRGGRADAVMIVVFSPSLHSLPLPDHSPTTTATPLNSVLFTSSLQSDGTLVPDAFLDAAYFCESS